MLPHNKTEAYKTVEGHIDNVVLYYFPDQFLPDVVFILPIKCISFDHDIP